MSDGAPLFGWGLRIVSAVPIPGAIPWPAPLSNPTALPDVIITVGATAAWSSWPDPYRRDEETLDFAPPGIARYRIAQDSILVEPHPDADPVTISALLIATALPALLWLRGRFMLHAAGLILGSGDSCIAIAGPSGAGKSTLSRWLVEHGARLVGDDTLAIDSTAPQPMCNGLPGGMFLHSGACRQFEPLTETLIVRSRASRLAAIVVLTPGKPLALRRLAGVEAFAAIMRNRHRPRIPALLGHHQAMLEVVTTLSRVLPVYELQFDHAEHAPHALGAQICALASGSLGLHADRP